MLTVKSPRRWTNSLVPSSGSTRKKTGAVMPWLVCCSSVTTGISGKAALRPLVITASARSSASVIGEASDLARTPKSSLP